MGQGLTIGGSDAAIRLDRSFHHLVVIILINLRDNAMSGTKPFIVYFRYLVAMLIIQFGTWGQWKPDTLYIDERFQDSRSVFNILLLYWV